MGVQGRYIYTSKYVHMLALFRQGLSYFLPLQYALFSFLHARREGGRGGAAVRRCRDYLDNYGRNRNPVVLDRKPLLFCQVPLSVACTRGGNLACQSNWGHGHQLKKGGFGNARSKSRDNTSALISYQRFSSYTKTPPRENQALTLMLFLKKVWAHPPPCILHNRKPFSTTIHDHKFHFRTTGFLFKTNTNTHPTPTHCDPDRFIYIPRKA